MGAGFFGRRFVEKLAQGHPRPSGVLRATALTSMWATTASSNTPLTAGRSGSRRKTLPFSSLGRGMKLPESGAWQNGPLCSRIALKLILLLIKYMSPQRRKGRKEECGEFMTPLWTDSHAHLYGCDEAGLDAVLSGAEAHGVHRILNAATSLQSSTTVVSPMRRPHRASRRRGHLAV